MEKVDNKQKVVLITGGTGGIGKATALLLARNDFITYISTRDLESNSVKEIMEVSDSEGLEMHFVYLDLTNDTSIEEAISTVVNKHGRIDILINNAATGYFSAVEDIVRDSYIFQMNVNVAGVIETIRHVLPHMRSQGSGKVINISSILGFSTVPLNAPYSSSKYAIESISETLATEVKPFGIDVIIVQPGDFHSNFIKNAKHAEYNESSPYYKLYKRKDDKIKSGMGGREPEFFAEKMFKICNETKPKLRYTIGREVLIKKLLHTILLDNLWINFLRRFYNW